MRKDMTAKEIHDARTTLGLSVAQFAEVLDTDAQSVRRWFFPRERSTHRPIPPRVGRLVAAYLSGYRPDDWPTGDPPEE